MSKTNFTHPEFFWVHENPFLTLNIWTLQKDSSWQQHEKTIHNFEDWHDSGSNRELVEMEGENINGLNGRKEVPYTNFFSI